MRQFKDLSQGGVRIGEFVSLCFKAPEFWFIVKSHSSEESDLPWGMLAVFFLMGQIQAVALKNKRRRAEGFRLLTEFLRIS